MPDLVSDEQLAEIEQHADRLESIMADSHGDDEPCSAVCEAAADVYDDVQTLVRALRDARDEAAREPIRTAIEYDHWRDAAIANRNEADSLRAAIEHALEDMGTSTLGAHLLRAALAAHTGQETDG